MKLTKWSIAVAAVVAGMGASSAAGYAIVGQQAIRPHAGMAVFVLSPSPGTDHCAGVLVAPVRCASDLALIFSPGRQANTDRG